MNQYSSIQINKVIYHSGNLKSLIKNHKSENDTEWLIQIHNFLEDWFIESDYIEIKTSGSTGTPKTIRVQKTAMIHSALATKTFFNLQKDNNALLCLPATYIAGKMMMVRAMVCELNLLINKPAANPFIKNKEDIDFVALSPYQLSHSLKILQTRPVHTIIVGGSAIPATLETACENLPQAIYETYGMTETVSHIALRKVNGKDKSEFFQVLPGIIIETDNRDCLKIKAPALFSDEIITNDIVTLQNEISFKWLGRIDNVINSGGIKIFPEQIERKLESFIHNKFIIGPAPDDKLSEKIILVIEGFEPEESEQIALITSIAQVLSKYEVPREIVYTPAFPFTLTGKFNRRSFIQSIL